MKMKKIGPPGGHASLVPPWIHQWQPFPYIQRPGEFILAPALARH